MHFSTGLFQLQTQSPWSLSINMRVSKYFSVWSLTRRHVHSSAASLLLDCLQCPSFPRRASKISPTHCPQQPRRSRWDKHAWAEARCGSHKSAPLQEEDRMDIHTRLIGDLNSSPYHNIRDRCSNTSLKEREKKKKKKNSA